MQELKINVLLIGSTSVASNEAEKEILVEQFLSQCDQLIPRVFSLDNPNIHRRVAVVFCSEGWHTQS